MPFDPHAPAPEALAREGRNCWRICRADRLAVLIDGENYFLALKSALEQARHSVTIIGWDIDSRTVLDRRPETTGPTAVGSLLTHLVDTRPGLEINVLVWESGFLYSLGREFLPRLRLAWMAHPRLRLRLDDAHPLGAAQHQKIVVVDDRVAFVGGMDLTSTRWDTRRHGLDDPRRADASGACPEPFHDMQMVVSGAVAAALGKLVRRRWRLATGRRLTPPPAPAHEGDEPWPDGVEPLMREVDVAIARTLPAWEGEPAVREVERLYQDMIADARTAIYAENQYFASRSIGRALARRLAEPDGPEVVAISCRDPSNFVERAAMGIQRARLNARLRKRDLHHRLHLFHAVNGGAEVKIHSKMMIVDDRMLRIGSANLNNRSMGVDAECDLLVEARGRPDVIEAIRRLRHDLMAEHLGVTADQVAQAEESAGGMAAAIQVLNRGGERGLAPAGDAYSQAWLDLAPDGEFLDPHRPYESVVLAQEEAARPGARPSVLRRNMIVTAAVLAGLAVTAGLWPLVAEASTPGLRSLSGFASALAAQDWTVPGLLALFVAGGALHLPALVLVVVTAFLFGFGPGLGLSVLGMLGGAIALYFLGRAVGRHGVRRLAGKRMNRVSRVLASEKALGVALLRLVPIAPYGVVSLTAGAVRSRFSAYAGGTLLGTLPAVTALSLFGSLLASALSSPDILTTGSLIVLTTLLIIVDVSLARRLERVAARPAGKEEEV